MSKKIAGGKFLPWRNFSPHDAAAAVSAEVASAPKIRAATAFRRANGGSASASAAAKFRTAGKEKNFLTDFFRFYLKRETNSFLQKGFICEKTDNGKNVFNRNIGNNYEMKISQDSSVELGNFFSYKERKTWLVSTLAVVAAVVAVVVAVVTYERGSSLGSS